ncbi:DUF1990 domain-containing protein [Streptomyces sp. NPDC001553]|uniref:DUF1990 family protein n=1 Tax=Streptomyces sp. NPDC001553 TaxID=3154385 RepID=UPI00332EF408
MTRLFSPDRDTVNYPEAGATALRPLPAGYNHLEYRVRIGHGRPDLEAAGAAVTTLRAHRASGMRVATDQEGPVLPGRRVEVGIGIGPLRVTAPCQVIWTAYEPDRIGFAYGTLKGHPECGEESFVVDMDADGGVWFTVTAFSRPGCWYTRLAGPAVPVLQRAYARLLGHTLCAVVRAG